MKARRGSCWRRFGAGAHDPRPGQSSQGGSGEHRSVLSDAQQLLNVLEDKFESIVLTWSLRRCRACCLPIPGRAPSDILELVDRSKRSLWTSASTSVANAAVSRWWWPGMPDLLASVRDATTPPSEARATLLLHLARAAAVVPTPPGMTPAIFTVAKIFRDLPIPSKLVTKDKYRMGMAGDYRTVCCPPRPVPPYACSQFPPGARRTPGAYAPVDAMRRIEHRTEELYLLKKWNATAEVE